jgi:copper transport protein
MRFLTPVVVGLVLAGLTLLTAPSAHAHAVLVASDPVDGTRLSSSPDAVHLTFDEPVKLIPGAVQVVSESGARVNTGMVLRPGGTAIDLPLPPRLPRGSYTAMWRLISADTHEVSGSISFGVDQDALAPPAQRAVSDPLGLAANVIRGGIYLGMILGIGLTAVCRLLWPWTLSLRATRSIMRAGWALLALASVAQFILAGPRSLGLSWAGVLDGAGLSLTADSVTGLVLMLRIALAAVVLAAICRRGTVRAGARFPRARSAVGALLAVGLAATVAVDGHAGVGTDAWLATSVTTLHLLSMSVWLGGLVALAVIVLPSRHADRLDRWSLTAFACVAVLILTGEYQAWRQVSPVEALWSTGYGITLLAKLAAVSAMLGLAYLGRRRLLPAALRRSVPLEAAFGAVVLVLTTALVAQPPARTLYGPAVALRAPLDDGRSAEIAVSSTRHGPIGIQLAVVDEHGGVVQPQKMSATLSSVDAGIASLPVRLAPGPADHWHSTYATAPRAGTWTLQITVGFTPTDAVATATVFRVW